MRPVLALALVLLGITLVLKRERVPWLEPAAAGGLADRALEIVVAAKGPLLPSATLPGGSERLGELVRLGDRTLVGTGRPGLRSAWLGRDLELRAERVYDVARSADERRALAAAIAAAEVGEVLVLASSGRLQPADGSEGGLAEVLAPLGARARPGAASPESWALIAARLAGGWVPLAEAHSRDSGVALAFVLAPDLERYRDFEGDFARVAARAQSEIFLEEELAHASLRTDGVALAPHRTVLGRPLDAIALPPRTTGGGAAQAARLAWSGVALGPGSGLIAWLGLDDQAGAEAGAKSDGVVFEVRVDGELVHGQPVLPGSPWKVVQIDLRRFAGRSVVLELSVDPRQTAVGDAALWGRPVLVHGYDRAPLGARAEER